MSSACCRDGRFGPRVRRRRRLSHSWFTTPALKRQWPLWLTTAALLVFGAGCAGPGASTAPPVAAVPSLVEAKRQVVAYVDSGRYEADIAAVAEQARTYLESRAQRGGKLAIVVDIDETALSNLPSMRANDYGFIVAGPCDLPREPCGLIAWFWLVRPEPMKPVLALVRPARSRG